MKEMGEREPKDTADDGMEPFCSLYMEWFQSLSSPWLGLRLSCNDHSLRRGDMGGHALMEPRVVNSLSIRGECRNKLALHPSNFTQLVLGGFFVDTPYFQNVGDAVRYLSSLNLSSFTMSLSASMYRVIDALILETPFSYP